jgi:DNA mismatch endonuclease (patch repair protein)
MRQVKSSKNASTELKLISIFKEYAVKGWRRGYKVEGKPDFIFRDSRTAVFTDGCFWHGHKCRNTTPKDHDDYWSAKIARNMKRDREITERLEQRGWRVIRIWECELKNKNREILLSKLSPLIETQQFKNEIFTDESEFI